MAATLFGKLFILLFSLGAFAFGVAMAWLMVSGIITNYKNSRAAWRSRRWPSAPGHILRSKVGHADGDTLSSRPIIEYKYEVDGVEYKADRLDFDDGADYSVTEAERIAAKYEKGAPVPVYYDPADPQKSALQRKQVGCGCGAVFVTAGLALLTAFLIALGVESLRDLFPK